MTETRKTTSVWCTTSFVGYHRWPEAPNSVSYLRLTHRHVFGVKVKVKTAHARQVEFHLLKELVNKIIPDFPDTDLFDNGLGSTCSCEKIAEFICETILSVRDDLSWVKTSVDEDGENGASILLERTTSK